VRSTFEVTLVETPAHLRRKKRPELRIALIDLAASSSRKKRISPGGRAEGWH
jgi:hypothetical protein